MTQHPLVVAARLRRHATSSCHVLRGRVMRVVPRANEAINETWIADRDRFSYEGRQRRGPRAEADGRARPALARGRLGDGARGRGAGPAAGRARARRGPARRAGLARRLDRRGSSTSRQQLAARARLRQRRPSPAARRISATRRGDPPCRRSAAAIARARAGSSAVLLVGSNVRKEAPIIAHRIRKGARCAARDVRVRQSAADTTSLFPVAAKPRPATATAWPQHLARIVRALAVATGGRAPARGAGAGRRSRRTPPARHRGRPARRQRTARDPARHASREQHAEACAEIRALADAARRG
ncbi:MAG: hypothetical protein MZV65_33955 [Chromatiales bacterium]|nr:hypothetical protein [Chromatiales bacterium]